jgi:hypothetical protein
MLSTTICSIAQLKSLASLCRRNIYEMTQGKWSLKRPKKKKTRAHAKKAYFKQEKRKLHSQF